MTRGYWGGVMLFSLMIAGASAWYVTTALQEKSTVELPLVPKPVPDVPVTEATPTPTPVTETQPAPGMATEPAQDTPLSADGKRRIQFTLQSSTAKKVEVVGSFNKWFRKSMTKKANTWSVTVEIVPGSYEYKFVVDGKKIKDPNNKNVSKTGNSILTVKPASAS